MNQMIVVIGFNGSTLEGRIRNMDMARARFTWMMYDID